MPTLLFYMDTLTGKLFKVIPLKESNNEHLIEYLDSLSVELIGAYDLYSELLLNKKYLILVNTINYLLNNKCEFKKCRREILKCINIVEKIKIESGD